MNKKIKQQQVKITKSCTNCFKSNHIDKVFYVFYIDTKGELYNH